jgi:hypothetical protein
LGLEHTVVAGQTSALTYTRVLKQWPSILSAEFKKQKAQCTIQLEELFTYKEQEARRSKEAKHGDQRKFPKARLQQRERKAESEGGGHKQRAEHRTSQRREREQREHMGEAREIWGGGGCPRTNHMGNAEIGTPRADMAQTARDGRVAPQMRGVDIKK